MYPRRNDQHSEELTIPRDVQQLTRTVRYPAVTNYPWAALELRPPTGTLERSPLTEYVRNTPLPRALESRTDARRPHRVPQETNRFTHQTFVHQPFIVTVRNTNTSRRVVVEAVAVYRSLDFVVVHHSYILCRLSCASNPVQAILYQLSCRLRQIMSRPSRPHRE
jgi:hypothetical protein